MERGQTSEENTKKVTFVKVTGEDGEGKLRSTWNKSIHVRLLL